MQENEQCEAIQAKIKQFLEELFHTYKQEKDNLIPILNEVQEKFGYIPKEAQKEISEFLKIPMAEIYGVITFYSRFTLEPKGKYIIKICDGTACHVRKSIPILKALQDELKLTDGQTTTEDLLFTVETVSCLGACGLAPVLTINEKVYGSMTPESTVKVLNEIREGI